MRTMVKVVAGLNALFQGLVGLVCIIAPSTAANLFKVEVSGVAMLALLRMFGGLLTSNGVVSGLIAQNPDRDRGLVAAYSALLLLNVGADLVVIGTGELRFDQLAIGMLLEAVLAVLLIFYRSGTVVTRPTPAR